MKVEKNSTSATMNTSTLPRDLALDGPVPPEVEVLIEAGRATGGPLPRYGDSLWRSLPWGDKRKGAALVVAAEAWRRHCSTRQVAEDLIEHLVEQDREINRRLRETSWSVAESLRATLPGWIASTPHAELVRRRSA